MLQSTWKIDRNIHTEACFIGKFIAKPRNKNFHIGWSSGIYWKVLKKELGSDKTKHKKVGKTSKIVDQQYQ